VASSYEGCSTPSMPRATDVPRGGRVRARSRAGWHHRRLITLIVAVTLTFTAACSTTELAPDEAPAQPPVSSMEPTPPEEDLEAPFAPEVADQVASAPAPTITPEAGPPLPDGRDALIARTERLVREAVQAVDDATLTVLVTDEYGREIAAHRADDPVLPASTLKIVTAAALLTTVGPDATFTTRLETTAPIDGDGVLRGDLLLVGSGDPALATDEYGRWVYPARPRTRLATLADTLVEMGLTHLEGDVVGAAPGFAGPSRADGWPDRYFSSFDARYASGLTVDAGLRTILTYPEPEEDDDGADPDLPGLLEVVEREEPGEQPSEEPEPIGPPDVKVDHVLDPAAHAASELIRLLEDRGVHVHGEGRSGEVEEPIVGRLASVQSPPMSELLRFAVQRSDNHLTDGLFKAIGRIRTGEGSWAHGDRALRQVLDRFGIDHAPAVFADGSGLSRDDRVTARLLVDLDRHMMGSHHAETWRSLMAVMGESGTLRDRLTGTVAAGRFHGKTGTLRDVVALSGTVVGDDGTRYHLAVIANDADGMGRWVARSLMDELVLQLSAEVAGCEVVPGPVPQERGSISRSTISC
jgi:serine-type D-Ala-D-Ala carboxypeptidase/endopeptidase (penicillin-binding protein 4)